MCERIALDRRLDKSFILLFYYEYDSRRFSRSYAYITIMIRQINYSLLIIYAWQISCDILMRATQFGTMKNEHVNFL